MFRWIELFPFRGDFSSRMISRGDKGNHFYFVFCPQIFWKVALPSFPRISPEHFRFSGFTEEIFILQTGFKQLGRCDHSPTITERTFKAKKSPNFSAYFEEERLKRFAAKRLLKNQFRLITIFVLRRF